MRTVLAISYLFLGWTLIAQIPDSFYYGVQPDSVRYPYTYNLKEVVVVEQREISDLEERKDFLRTRFCVQRVYPIAMEALELMADTDTVLSSIDKRRKERKHLRRNYRALKSEYKEAMKDMYVEEGRVLIKIIERETGMPFYEVVKKYRGFMDAEFWNKMAQMQGYSLKEGYDPEKDQMLERVLQSYEKEVDEMPEELEGKRDSELSE